MSAFLSFWAEAPYGREAYEERPSALVALAAAAHQADPVAFDAFLVVQIAARAPEALLVSRVSEAPEVTAAIRARVADAVGEDRVRVAELLGARGFPEECRALLVDMLGGPDARHATGPLLRLGGPDLLDPVLRALGVAQDESARRDLRDLALQLAGFSDTLHRTIAWALWEEHAGVRAWGIAALRQAVADRDAGRPWATDAGADSPALKALIRSLRTPDLPLDVGAFLGPDRWVAVQVLILAHFGGEDARALPALQALGGELAAAALAAP